MADKSILNIKIIEANNLLTKDQADTGSLPTQFPKTAFNTFKTAIAVAKRISTNDPIATQAEVDAEITILEQAITDFPKSVIPSAIKTSLMSARDTALIRVNAAANDYPLLAITNLSNAISNANIVIANTKATQIEVDAATTALYNALLQFTASKSTAVSSISIATKIGPNPITDVLNISSTEMIQSVTIITFNGTIAKQIAIESTSSQIDFRSLGSGFYIVKISFTNGNIAFKTISVIK
jgi:hypothetical protein